MAAAGQKLRPGDVHAVDRPLWRQERHVLPIADSHFQAERRRSLQPAEMADDFQPGLARPTLHHQEAPFPSPESSPARTVVERRRYKVSARKRTDRFQDPVPNRVIASAAGAARLSLEQDAARQAARQLL